LEWVLQKVTELGVSEIYLLEAEYSVVKVPRERIEKRLQRWTKIVIGAVKQSRRSNTPVLHAPEQCQTVCTHLQADLKLLFSERESARHLKVILGEFHKPSVVALAVGPEGGWTSHEEAVFVQHQFHPASLGSSILRTETAAIAALAVLKYELEDHEACAPVPSS
jgi:16S rRNA (uracil1498-N3)-methyltransferase